MILPPEYKWLESYLANDNYWLDDSLSWEEAFTLVLSDFTLVSSLSTPFFTNSHFYLDSLIKLSFLDVMFIIDINQNNFSREVYDLFLWDLTSTMNSKYIGLQFLFYTDYQDFMLTLLYYSPELLLAITDFLNQYWFNVNFSQSPLAIFNFVIVSTNAAVGEFADYCTLFILFIWIVLGSIGIFRMLKWNNPLETYFLRVLNYIFSSARETRVQVEAFFLVFFLLFFYWSMLIVTFDDEQEEILEVLDVCLFCVFSSLIVFLVLKYSIHYLCFLEASVSEGKTVSFLIKQFFRDFVNTLALLLRFFILLFRLNAYDALDDFYDSYFIFVGDFDDDEYLTELFMSFAVYTFYEYDTNDDQGFWFEDENEFLIDLFYSYAVCLAKLTTFILFLLEEIFRMALGFFICYLIVYEVHSVNCSYVEDVFIQNARLGNPNKRDITVNFQIGHK